MLVTLLLLLSSSDRVSARQCLSFKEGEISSHQSHLKRPWCWTRVKAGGEGDNRGWDGWMTSPTRWTWVWVNSRSWWWTGRPGVLQSMGSQRVWQDWETELNWTEYHACMLSVQSWLLVILWTIGYSVHGILQARILQCVAVPSS